MYIDEETIVYTKKKMSLYLRLTQKTKIYSKGSQMHNNKIGKRTIHPGFV